MFDADQLTGSKPEQYAQLLQQARGLLSGERDRIANAANLSALAYHGLPSLKDRKSKAPFRMGGRKQTTASKDRRRARRPMPAPAQLAHGLQHRQHGRKNHQPV